MRPSLRSTLLAEGGAVGHLMHLYDNRDLSFAEIANIIKSASVGRLERVSEKLDGLNIVFSWNIAKGDLVTARNEGNIKGGGMGAEELAAMFSGRGNLTTAFNSAFKVLRGAIETLPDAAKVKVFGEEANRWYSAEVVYTKNPNVINYDRNAVVFHGWPVFNVAEDPEDPSNRTVEMSEDSGGVEILERYVKQMQATVAQRGWQVQGPAIVRLKGISDRTLVTRTVETVLGAPASVGLGNSSTMGEYIAASTERDVEGLDLPPKVAEMVVKRCMREPGAPSLIDIKKKADKSSHGNIDSFVKGFPERLKEYVRPIELAINDFAVELLKGLKSTLIDDTETEVLRLRGEVERAIGDIEASGDENAMGTLRTQMEKLESVSNITSPVEGVVFIYKGNAYKFTGSFAAANRILGLFRYGSKGKKS